MSLGLDGHRFGPGLRTRRERARRVHDALAAVGATAPVGRLSGGELRGKVRTG